MSQVAATLAAGASTGAVPRPLWPVVVAMHVADTGRRWVVALPDADAVNDCAAFLLARGDLRRIVALPGWDIPPLDHAEPDPRILARQAVAAEALATDAWDVLLVDAGAYHTPLVRWSYPARTILAKGARLDEADLRVRGYRRVSEVGAPGEYAVRGEVVDLWSPLMEQPARVERFDVTIDELRRFDPVSQLSARPLDTYDLGIAGWPPLDHVALAERVRRRAARTYAKPEATAHLIERLTAGEPCPARALWYASMLARVALPEVWDIGVSPSNIAARSDEAARLLAAERNALELEGLPIPHVEIPPQLRAARLWVDADLSGDADPGIVGVAAAVGGDAAERLRALVAGHDRASGWRVWLTGGAGEVAALKRLAHDAGVAAMCELEVVPVRVRGHWDISVAKLRLIDGAQLLRRRYAMRARRTLRGLDLGDLSDGDLVVHADYGIARFSGLERLELDGIPLEFVKLVFAGGDQVFVPVTKLSLLEPYRGGEGNAPALDKLGSGAFERRRSKAKEELLKFAADLIDLYAKRERAEREPLPPPGELSLAVESSFPFEETPDQLRALEDIERDLAAPRPMDRLLIGDVGYGKTEVALRTAVRFVEAGMQVSILVPTTVLAVQHGRTFHERLRDLPVRIGVLSRFTPAAEQARVLMGLRSGEIDIVIGTHRLLQPDVAFKHLGLLVVDEEHRFGVAAKEALKALRRDLDSLAMSATPIPRTLQMHMGGVRPLSIISTPPPNRLAVETRVMPYDDDTVREALQRERARGGQAFYLVNRIALLGERAERLQRLIPDLRVAVAHGKMRPAEVEDALIKFLDHRVDVLVATTIIESGLDFPRANTMLIEDAHNYGLAELYQLRGRIGRADRRAFCYLFHGGESNLSTKAAERLDVLRSFSNMGGGFHVAMRDLEIRGAGELLGKRQAGHIRAVGLATAMHLLEEALAEAQGEAYVDAIEPEFKGDLALVLSSEWITAADERLRAYQQLARAQDPLDVYAIMRALEDRFGPAGENDRAFIEAMRLKPALRTLAVRSLQFSGTTASLFFDARTPLEPVALATWAQAREGVTLKPDRLVIAIPPHGGEYRVASVAAVVEELLRLARV